MAEEKKAAEAPKEAKQEPKEQKQQAQPQQGQPRHPKKEGKPQHQQQKATSIIRMGGKDINGAFKIERALDEIKGIGSNLSQSISYVVETKLGIPRNTTLGSLSEGQIESIEGVIQDPIKYGIPNYMLNHRKDMETGRDIHIIGNDLTFAVRQDVNRQVTMRAWKGYRHQRGQKVRGQHTRSTGRTGATVGVMKKAAKQQLAASQQEKGKEASAPAAKK